MNKILTEHIVKHILSNFGAIESNYVDFSSSKSLLSSEYLLPDELLFEDENEKQYKNKIYGCQLSTEQQELKILLSNCSQDEILEFYLIIQLKNAPAYGLYLYDDGDNSESKISCKINNGAWMDCNMYLQATFLAGVEQLRDLGFGWNKCSNYKEQYNLLLSFIGNNN